MTKFQKPLSKFIENYKLELSKSIKNLDNKKLQTIIKLIRETIIKNRRIFTCGNGGSASVSNHFLCDFNKGVKYFSKKKFNQRLFLYQAPLKILQLLKMMKILVKF